VVGENFKVKCASRLLEGSGWRKKAGFNVPVDQEHSPCIKFAKLRGPINIEASVYLPILHPLSRRYRHFERPCTLQKAL
jgi:hypothetical protein